MCFLQILINYLQKLNRQLYGRSIYSMLKSMKNMNHNINAGT
jgi:hypothetical protein